MEQQQFREAISLMEPHLAEDSGGDLHALLAVAHYHSEEYDQAAEFFQAALQRSPNNVTWRELLGEAKSNALAEVQVPVPDIYFFDREQLLARPGDAHLPPPPPRRAGRGLVRNVAAAAGNLVGLVATFGMAVAIQFVGRVIGYRDEVWTNWYRKRFVVGILTLAYLREQLNKNNLKNTYPPGSLVAFQPEGQSPPVGVTHFRTADGSWNNLSDPKEGAAHTRFPRNVANNVIVPETGDRLMTPNPREVSLAFLTRGEEMKEVPFLNLIAAVWINFQNHDWVHHGQNMINEVHEVPLPANDPAREKYRQKSMFIPKTQPDPTRMPDRDQTPVTFINEVTHWWDGSQIYGSNQETVDRLRSRVDGKLKLNEDGSLPLGKHRVEDTGFNRNWWVGLTLLHNLFAREHNSICDHLKGVYPEWDDDRLFNVARLINAAIMAKIHSVEWTPAILPNRVLDSGLNSNWYGALTNLFRIGRDRQTLADVNVRNPEMGGIVGNSLDRHGAPYGLTEEFTEVYRLHSLLPEHIKLRRVDGSVPDGEVPFVETRQAGSPKLTKEWGVGNLLYSFGTQHPGQLVMNNYPKFMQELSVPGNPLFDMGVVDILRARERGVPRYNEFRRQLGLNPLRSFEDLTSDPEQVRKLKEVYGSRPEDVENLDLLVGTLGEAHRPTNFGFGETMFQIFILNASRRLQADRFYTDSYNEETYTPEGLRWIDLADLKTVLLRNYPELAKTGLANVKNAFEPWDTEDLLDENRHPLRAYDRSLRPNPWQGDVARGRG
ncbi:MAG: tetratricopeptide repeat protein [Chloroflexi bacterium]|nr:tetratricopeptide repeat protein [Chloroflexota bacterium]